MRPRTLVVGTVAAMAAALLSPPAAASAATGADRAASDAAKADQHVIVLMRDQPAVQPAGSAAATARSRAIAADQAPLMRQMRQQAASHVKGYRLTNAVAATVAPAEVRALQTDPSVAAVIPDTTIRLASGAKAEAAAAAPKLHAVPGACSATPKLDEPVPVLKADSDDRKAVTARSLGYTGKGVRVAWIADGIDTKNVNFLRDPADPSSSIFADYKDFSSDGPDAVTEGAEAFLDANAIAGQGKHVYDVSGFGPQAQKSPCNVRIEGVAPGASLVGLKVFSETGATTTSNFLQAIDYAVTTDRVDVLNESFGGNPFPDTTADVVKQFNDAAVAAGVAVTVSSGDAGPFNTNGSPSTDSKVIAVGATTTFRFYAQTDYALARSFATRGWLNDNISGLSSSGVPENGQVLNVVAPGDLSWASCDASAQFTGCLNYFGQPSEIESSGGTSESAPLTAGAAALIIEAYAEAHGGAHPSPALIKRILTSTATDLGTPAAEQGTGLVNTLAAVRMAASVNGGTRHGDTLQRSVDELTAAGNPQSAHSWRVTLTNTGTRTQHVRLSGRAIGSDGNVQTGSVTLSDASSPKLTDQSGVRVNYRTVHLRVAAGQARLTAEYAYPGDPTKGLNQRVRLILVDPRGRLAAHSIPQGVGNHAFIDVRKPTTGTWTAVIFSRVASAKGTVGRVPYRFATQRFTSFAGVSPASMTVAAGRSRTVTVSARTPASPGNATGSIVVASDRAGTGSIPVVLRSSIVPKAGGRFSGVLTGGNGRQADAQHEYYTFTVPKGVHDVTANLTLARTPQNVVGLYLVSPHGDAVGYGQNTLGGASSLAATAWTLNPTPGTWTLIVAFASPVAGIEVRDPFSGTVVFDRSRATATGLPNSATARLAAGTPVTVPVRITNTGAAPAQFSLDARLRRTEVLPLAGLTKTAGVAVPTNGSVPEWFVPSETTLVVTGATSPLPIQFDLNLASGDPDVGSRGLANGSLCATSEAAAYATRDRTVASGVWFAVPSECGPYAAPAPKTTADFATVAVTRSFDPAVTSTTGDVQLTATDATTTVKPVTISAGGSALVTVTITPRGTPGTRVQGDLFVDTVLDNVPPYGQFSADEVTSLPYSYTIK